MDYTVDAPLDNLLPFISNSSVIMKIDAEEWSAQSEWGPGVFERNTVDALF